MKNEQIDLLVLRYLNAESTGREDAMLKKEFLNNGAPDKYKDLEVLFGYFELQKSQTVIPAFQNPAVTLPRQNARIFSMPWLAAAASVAILIVAFLFFNQNNTASSMDTFSDPEVAAQNAVEALQLLSGELNKGRTLAMDQMKEFDHFTKYLNIF